MPVIGDLLAVRYRIDARLGAGGMGTVWRAHDLRLDRDVAVKVLLPTFGGDPVLTERFDREARALAAVASPHVIAIHDVVTGVGGDPFIVMELCPDGSLGDRLDASGTLPPAEALPLLADAAEGLVALHGRGILHRDVTPRNVLLSAGRAKLGDLGLARSDEARGRPAATELTAAGTTVGTLAYLAPELLEGDPPTTASDVYGLGAVAYRTLTGVLPHAAGNVAELVTARLEPVAPLDRYLPGVAPGLADLLSRALDRQPAARPTAVELATGLRELGRAAALAAGQSAGDAIAGPAPGIALGIAGALDGPDAETRAAIPTALTGAAAPGGPASPDRSSAAAPIAARPRGGSDRYRGPSLWTGELILIAIVAVIVLVGLLALAGAFGAGSGVAPAPTGSPAVATASPSPAASPSIASPSLSPSEDAFSAASARAADLAAAIDAAKGPGGLKGNDAKKLSDLVNQVSGALAAGDAAAASSATDAVTRQVQDDIDHGQLQGEPGQAVAAAVGALEQAVAALPR